MRVSTTDSYITIDLSWLNQTKSLATRSYRIKQHNK